jgi:hypothetical protein
MSALDKGQKSTNIDENRPIGIGTGRAQQASTSLSVSGKVNDSLRTRVVHYAAQALPIGYVCLYVFKVLQVVRDVRLGIRRQQYR